MSIGRAHSRIIPISDYKMFDQYDGGKVTNYVYINRNHISAILNFSTMSRVYITTGGDTWFDVKTDELEKWLRLGGNNEQKSI